MTGKIEVTSGAGTDAGFSQGGFFLCLIKWCACKFFGPRPLFTNHAHLSCSQAPECTVLILSVIAHNFS